MKNKLYKQRGVHHKTIVFYVLLFMVSFSYGQVGIGNTNPQATIDITASNQATPSNEDGILIPRVDTFSAINPTVTQDGMLVYLTMDVTISTVDYTKGFHYWDQGTTSWIRFSNIEKINDLSDGKSDVDGSQDGSSIFVGIQAGENDDSADRRNVGVGYRALRVNTIGANNAAFGYLALQTNNADNNSAFGWYAMRVNSSGVGNSAFGKRALEDNTTANHNTAMGSDALRNNTVGFQNTAVGNGAMFTNTIGDLNVAMGQHALYNNVSGNNNTAIGTEALTNNTQSGNTAIGYFSLNLNVGGLRNTGVGNNSLRDNISGDSNTSVGHNSLVVNTASNNTALGAFAGQNLVAGNNVIIGHNAGRSLTSGSSNVIIGRGSGQNTGAGGNNVFIGNNSGQNTTGSLNVFIGNNAGTNGAFAASSQTLLIQNTGGATPLIYGEFDNSIFRINGELQVADPSATGYAFPLLDGSADQILVTDGAGQLTFEDQAPDVSTFPIIRATLGANQALGAAGWQKVAFNNVTLNPTTSTEFNTTNYNFVAATTGVYRIDASYHTTTSQTNTQYYGIAVYINGAIYQEYSVNHYYNGINSSQVARQISCVASVTAGQTIEIFALDSAVGVTLDSSATKTHFTIQRIR